MLYYDFNSMILDLLTNAYLINMICFSFYLAYITYKKTFTMNLLPILTLLKINIFIFTTLIFLYQQIVFLFYVDSLLMIIYGIYSAKIIKNYEVLKKWLD